MNTSPCAAITVTRLSVICNGTRHKGSPDGSPSGQFLFQSDQPGHMIHRRQDPVHQIVGTKPQAGGVDAGVAAEVFTLQHILVDEQLHLIFRIVHQPQHTDGAGGNVQQSLHMFRTGEGQAGGADLLAQYAGFELLVTGDHQQIKFRLLPVAQQQILADFCPKSNGQPPRWRSNVGLRRFQRPKSYQTRTGRTLKVLNRGSQAEGLGKMQNDMGWHMWEHQTTAWAPGKPPQGQ